MITNALISTLIEVRITVYSYGYSPLMPGAEIKSVQSPFLFLALDLPPPPLFQDAVEKNILPQVTLASVLAKYDGRTTQASVFHQNSIRRNLFIPIQESAGQLKRYRCTRLPPYIILHYKRFTKNNFVEEKNPTIVNFPVRGADFRDGQEYCYLIIRS